MDEVIIDDTIDFEKLKHLVENENIIIIGNWHIRELLLNHKKISRENMIKALDILLDKFNTINVKADEVTRRLYSKPK